MRSLQFTLTVAWAFAQICIGANLPNFVLIMVDDMGFSDLGCYGGEVDTPHLDHLAERGLRYTQFYNTGRCWPTRASLLMGVYPHEARHAMPWGHSAPEAYRGTGKSDGLLISEVLKAAGYQCYHSGKWHLDSRGKNLKDTWPLARGFDRSYFLKSQHNFFNPWLIYDDEKKVTRPGVKGDYYATEVLTEKAIGFLKAHPKNQPFFLYLAHVAPHFPLHAPEEDIERHVDRYRVGWDEIRKQRHEKLQTLGLYDGPLAPRDPLVPAWQSLSESEQEMWATRMAIHAAMIHVVDRGVGQLVGQLKAMEVLENTLILFLSDNGASAEYIVRGDGHDPEAIPGSSGSYLCLEVGWSNAANTPFREHKMWMHEGGIATPLIAHWPDGIVNPGLIHRVGHVIDILPTFAKLAGLEAKGEFLFNLPVSRTLFWEHTGNKALRVGDKKIVKEHGKPWELYDLENDRSESIDLADRKPALLRELVGRWQSNAEEQGVVPWGSLPQSKQSPGPDYRKK